MSTHTDDLCRLISQQCRHARVLVVGDVMIDKYVWGQVRKLSPEAPVPVLHVKSTSLCAGGAANVALNLSRLGCRVRLVGLVGNDDDGAMLRSLLAKDNINTSSIVTDPLQCTTAKTRIIAGQQQIVRLDHEGEPQVSDATALLKDVLDAELRSQPQCIVLSDYGKGTLGELICQKLIGYGRSHSIPTVVGPKGTDFAKYSGATAVVPNRAELAAATATPVEELTLLLQSAQRLRHLLGLECMVITLSELGIAILGAQGTVMCPARAREVFDVSGAGDTVLAVLAALLANGIPIHEAGTLANTAAGIVVSKRGTVPITREELLNAMMRDCYAPQDKVMHGVFELLHVVAGWRASGDRIVFTNGCFDIVHAGHIGLLQGARRKGHRLVVGVNTDSSVRRLKGSNRPIIGERERVCVVSAIEGVDAVILFDEDTPLELIEMLRPDVIVKGGDYCEKDIVGSHEVQRWNGQVVVLPIREQVSTSALIRRIRRRNDVDATTADAVDAGADSVEGSRKDIVTDGSEERVRLEVNN